MTDKQKSYWHTPPFTGACCFEQLGYVLFRSDDTEGCVLASHVADPSVHVGDSFWKRLKLSLEEIATLRTALADGHACWLITELGVGFISARYDLWAGYFLYVHVHDHPSAVRRLLYRGYAVSAAIQPPPLGGLRTTSVADEKDQEVLNRLQPVLAHIDRVQVLPDAQRSDGHLPLASISEWIHSSADFFGCPTQLKLTDDSHEGMTVSCPAPRLIEGVTLYWMCLLHRLFPEEEMGCTVSPYMHQEESVLRITLDVTVEQRKMKERLLGNKLIFSDMNHMIYKGELCGVKIVTTADEVSTIGQGTPCFCLTVDLLFIKNPAKSPPSGLKNALNFTYDQP